MLKIYFLSRITMAIIWLYHGIVPKLIFSSHQEVMMNSKLIPMLSEKAALISTGIIEVIYALLLIFFFRSKILIYPTIIFGSLVTIALIVSLPNLFVDAFNPFSINLSIVVLAIINLISNESLKET